MHFAPSGSLSQLLFDLKMLARGLNLRIGTFVASSRSSLGSVRRITRGNDGVVDIAATVEKLKPQQPKLSGFQRVKNFISKNKQAIMNTLGVYFVFAYAVHNYRVSIAWDKREEEFVALESEFGSFEGDIFVFSELSSR